MTRELRGRVVDARTGEPLAARIYIEGPAGSWHFARSDAPEGTAVRYEKRNWVNQSAVEFHATLSAHPFVADLAPGSYTITVERGKEYFPERRDVAVGAGPVEIEVKLRRWIDMAARGWYSGDTHVHRTIDELRNVAISEDLNVSFPLTFWIMKAFTPPTAGDRSAAGEVPEGLISLDESHVIWPRNTEYEIVSVGGKAHTLGALFLLGHRSIFDEGVPPWGPVARKAAAEGALLDMDKLDWPFSFCLPHATGATLYELANNHVWRTEFGFTGWVSEAPPLLQPPFGGKHGGEREWVGYTLGMYYALLDCGFRLSPTAGTASGVHPVPLGFSRVYVRLPDGFSYEGWLAGLAKGRSFVTTGPMLFATVDGRDPGETFREAAAPAKLRIAGSVVSEEPLAFIEVVRNGLPWRTYMPQNRRTEAGAHESSFAEEVGIEESGWIAVRAWEDRPGGRFRFAHSAPWWIEIPGRPLRPRAEERDFLAHRMREELARSRGVVPEEGIAEYERALAAYEKIAARDDSVEVEREGRRPTSDAELRFWLETMVWHHRYTPREIRAATGLGLDEIDAALRRFGISEATRPSRPKDSPILVLPYPGGRHPRAGFLDGAIDPQRETKISVFPPWDGGAADRSGSSTPAAAGSAGYFVVDVPEAIFSNLGLLYLAHTHVPTIWDARGEKLPRLEWTRHDDGSLDFERSLPGGIAFGTKVVPGREAVRMEMWIRNGTGATLTGLRVQNCILFQAARGFSAQTNRNKVLAPPYAAARSDDGLRWIITAWHPFDRTWANPPVPCLHSDPRFPDCPPGET
ncbi:MAG: CehA/McbA family metallohydrolase, partial [Planctomycetes bacterium]|nr:CehA/McbA family metallohydrolase [Planctomycetota bacterium]